MINPDKNYKSVHVQRGETLPPFIPVGKEEWFIAANELLIKAEKKYNLFERITKYLAEKNS